MVKLGRALFMSAALLLAGGCSSGTGPEMQLSHVLHEELPDSDIPAAWVLEGTPKAKTKWLARSEDGAVMTALWECSKGKFEWHFGSDELVHILVGSVTVRSEDGKEQTLKVGDVAYFPAGMRTVWTVHDYVRKLAVLRDNSAPFALRAKRKLNELFAMGD